MIRHFRDLWYTVEATVGEYSVGFHIFKIEAYEGLTQDDSPLYDKKEQEFSGDHTSDITEAEVFCHGNVKWDGCSNWYFDSQDDCYLHGCEREHLVNIGLILAACWDMAKELCPNWCD